MRRVATLAGEADGGQPAGRQPLHVAQVRIVDEGERRERIDCAPRWFGGGLGPRPLIDALPQTPFVAVGWAAWTRSTCNAHRA